MWRAYDELAARAAADGGPAQYSFRAMPSRFILFKRVVRFRASRSAAPSLPKIFPFVCFSAAMIAFHPLSWESAIAIWLATFVRKSRASYENAFGGCLLSEMTAIGPPRPNNGTCESLRSLHF